MKIANNGPVLVTGAAGASAGGAPRTDVTVVTVFARVDVRPEARPDGTTEVDGVVTGAVVGSVVGVDGNRVLTMGSPGRVVACAAGECIIAPRTHAVPTPPIRIAARRSVRRSPE